MSNVRNIRSAASARVAKTNTAGEVALLILAVIGVLLLIAALVVAGGLLTMFAWNVGVAALVAAAGGHVANIGLLTAIAVNVAIGIIGRIFKRGDTNTASTQS